MQTFDYKDESKDVKGKVSKSQFLMCFIFLDWPFVSYQRALVDSSRLEERCEFDHPKFGRCDPNDRKKHL